MRKIVLFCAGGMSTSMLVQRMRSEAKEINYECSIEAFAISQAAAEGKDADIILLWPQVAFNLDKVKSECKDVRVEVIDMVAYGMMDAKKVLARVKEVLGD